MGLVGYLAYLLYQYIPGEQQNFQITLPSKLPAVNASSSLVQFVPNMRFNKNNLKYYIYEDCSLQKIKRVQEAFSIISSETQIIYFAQTTIFDDADITIFCSEVQKEISENKFIAGEGGPSEYLNLSLYPLIISGEVLLYDTLYKDKCAYPVVEIHELLHVFGFDHISNTSSILYPYYSCTQRLDKEVTAELKRLYSIEPKSDLFFKEASASKTGIYLTFEIQIQNVGLIDSKQVSLKVLSNNFTIDSFEMEEISPGTTKTLSIQNLMLPKKSMSEIQFRIESSSPEYYLNNNEITAKI